MCEAFVGVYFVVVLFNVFAGELSPDFLAICDPNIAGICSGNLADVSAGRQGFISLVTAVAFAVNIFLALYISGKVNFFYGQYVGLHHLLFILIGPLFALLLAILFLDEYK